MACENATRPVVRLYRERSAQRRRRHNGPSIAALRFPTRRPASTWAISLCGSGGRFSSRRPAVSNLKLERAVVGWKETPEARRAVFNALPLLKEVASVKVAAIVGEAELEEARFRLEDVVAWLGRHGIAAEPITAASRGDDASELESDRAGSAGRPDRRRRLRPQPSTRMGVRRRDERYVAAFGTIYAFVALTAICGGPHGYPAGRNSRRAGTDRPARILLRQRTLSGEAAGGRR